MLIAGDRMLPKPVDVNLLLKELIGLTDRVVNHVPLPYYLLLYQLCAPPYV